MNLALLERHAQEERPASAGDWLFVVLMVALVVLVAVIPFVIVGWLVATAVRQSFLRDSGPGARAEARRASSCCRRPTAAAPRARLMTSPNAAFELARQLQSRQGAALGDVFSFVSGLYFRGKLAYARRFARPPDPADPVVAGGVLVITPNAGLRAADTPVTLRSFQRVCGDGYRPGKCRVPPAARAGAPGQS